MSVISLADLVQRMRRAQVDYFRTRDPAYLRDSKSLEKQVDHAVAAILGTEQQKGLPL